MANDVTVDGLNSALEDLIKAADAVDLIKGGDSNGVEHSGTTDEDGKKGGGRGSYPGDVALDRLMIGKLADLGFSASQISAMNDGLLGFADHEEPDADDEGGEDDDDEDDQEMSGSRRKAKKSKSERTLRKSMDEYRADSDLADTIDVSAYLESFTARTADQIDKVNGSLRKGFGSQATVNRALAGALHQMGSLLKSNAVVVHALGTRLNLVERTPNAPRGVTNAAALHKSMPGEAGHNDSTKLSKAEILSTMSYMNLEKGIRHIEGQRTVEAIGLLEGGNVCSPAVLKAVNEFHVKNPSESALARAYH